MNEDPGPLPPDAAPTEQAGDRPPVTDGPAVRAARAGDAAPTGAGRAPADRRWLDRILWFWPLVVIGLLAVAGQLFGAFGVTAAAIAAVTVIVMVVGGATFERPTTMTVLAVTTGLIGLVFLGWQLRVLPDEPVRSAAADTSPRPSVTPSSQADLLTLLNNGWGAGADLRGADLTAERIADARLDGARAPGITLVETILDGGSLAGANLRGAKMSGVRLREANLRGAVLAGADLPDGILTDACLTGADFTGADLTNADLTGATVDGARLDGPATRAVTGWNTPSEKGRAACD